MKVKSPFPYDFSEYLKEKGIMSVDMIDRNDLFNYIENEKDFYSRCFAPLIIQCVGHVWERLGSFTTEGIRSEASRLSLSHLVLNPHHIDVTFSDGTSEKTISFLAPFRKYLKGPAFEDPELLNCMIAGYVSTTVRLYVSNSSWHYGFSDPDGKLIDRSEWPSGIKKISDKKIPLFWFGPHNDRFDRKWSWGFSPDCDVHFISPCHEYRHPYLIEPDEHDASLLKDENGFIYLDPEKGAFRWFPEYGKDFPACPADELLKDRDGLYVSYERIRKVIAEYIFMNNPVKKKFLGLF